MRGMHTYRRLAVLDRPLILFLIILLAGFSSYAQKRDAKLKSYLERVEAFGFSGQVLVAEQGKVIMDRAFGYADRSRGTKNTTETVFNVASFTKQFTAAAILRLEQEGKLNTADQIGKYLDGVPADKAQITLEQLLTHTSGLRRGNAPKERERDDVVRTILSEPLAARPGERFIYSNNGYHLLAAVVEKVSGMSFGDYLAAKLFRPAGMSRSGVFTGVWQDRPIAVPYNEWERLDDFTAWKKTWNYGSGSVVSTAGDLYKWLQALDADAVISAGQKARLFASHTPADDPGVSYGYGWFITTTKDGGELIYHGGDNTGYHSEVRRYVRAGRIIIILSNQEILEPDGMAVQKRIIANNINRILSGETYSQPPAFIRLGQAELERHKGDYVLPGGGRLHVDLYGHFLTVGAEGQDAVDLLTGTVGESGKKYSTANEMADLIMSNLKSGQNDRIIERLGKEDYDNYIPFLDKELQDFKKRMGEFRSYKVQGTASFPWNADDYRTYITLQYERGATDLFLGWNNAKLDDLTTETGRPFPVILTLVPRTRTDFSTFEMVRSSSVSFRFERSGDAEKLVIGSGDQKIVATKTGPSSSR